MHAHVRKHAAKTIWVAAAFAWTAVINADALNWPEHIWRTLLVIAGILTGSAVLPALLSLQVAERVDRHYAAITRGVIALAEEGAPTPPPWPALRAVPDDDDQQNEHRASL